MINILDSVIIQFTDLIIMEIIQYLVQLIFIDLLTLILIKFDYKIHPPKSIDYFI